MGNAFTETGERAEAKVKDREKTNEEDSETCEDEVGIGKELE